MRAFKNPNIGLYAIGVGLLVLLVIASIFYVAARNRDINATQNQNMAVTEAPIESPTITPTNDVVIPVTSPTPTISPSASPSVTPTVNVVGMPDSVRTFLANFYAAYKARDRAKLAASFTVGSDPASISEHTDFFEGPNGPTLFSSNSLLEHATDYTILGGAPQDKNWVITVSEKRVSGTGQDIGAFSTLLTLVPTDQGGWLIDNYIHAGSTGKYNGFFTP